MTDMGNRRRIRPGYVKVSMGAESEKAWNCNSDKR